MIARTSRTDYLSVGQACREFGLSAPTLRSILDQNDNLCFRSIGGHRRVSRRALSEHLGLVQPTANNHPRKVMCAIRISSKPQATSLEYQRERTVAWCKENLPDHEIIINERICSGLFLSHENFIQIILSIVNKEISDLVVLHQDRLARGAVDMLKALMERFGVTLHVLESKPDKSYGESMAEDIIAFIGSHHARYQGAKAKAKLEITVSEDNLLKIYSYYKQGYSYKDLAELCAKQGIIGEKGETLSAAKLCQLLNRNQKILEELMPVVDSNVEEFIKSHLKPLEGYKATRRNQDDMIRQKDVYTAYVKWCEQKGVVPVSPKKLGVAMMNLGYEWTRAKQGLKCWWGTWTVLGTM